MKIYKLILIVLVFSFCSGRYTTPIAASGDKGTILRVYTEYFDGDVTCYLGEIEDYLEIFKNTSTKIPVTVEYSDKRTDTIWLPIKWEFNMDVTQAGRYTSVGTIDYTGYHVGNGCATYILQDFVLVIEPHVGEKKLLKKVGVYHSINTKMIEVNDEENLNNYLENELPKNNPVFATTEYELDGVSLIVDKIETKADITTPGSYEVISHFKLSDEDDEKFILPEELSFMKTYICIYNPNQLQIAYYSNTNKKLTFISSQDLIEDQLEVEILTSSTPLSNKELCLLEWLPYADYELQHSSKIDLPITLFEQHDYIYIQIKHGDEISNIFGLNYRQNNIIVNDYEGNRDGGDSEDGEVGPPMTQLPPSIEEGKDEPIPKVPPTESREIPDTTIEAGVSSMPSSENIFESGSGSIATNGTSDASKILEEISGDTLKMNGIRIQYLLNQYSLGVPFGWNNIQLELSHAFLSSLHLSSNDTLSLTLLNEENNYFSINLQLNGQVIKDIPGSRVTLVTPSLENKLLYENNTLPTTFTYNQGYLTFVIDYTGRYQLVPTDIEIAQENITETNHVSPTANSYLPVIIVAISIVLVGIGYVFKKRKVV